MTECGLWSLGDNNNSIAIVLSIYKFVFHMERTSCFVFMSCGISDESFASKPFPEESLWELNRRITHILLFCNCQCFLVVSVLCTDKCIDDCCENVMFSYLATVVMGRIWHVFGLLQPRYILKSILMKSMIHIIVLWQGCAVGGRGEKRE